jgi:hypothetical protein
LKRCVFLFLFFLLRLLLLKWAFCWLAAASSVEKKERKQNKKVGMDLLLAVSGNLMDPEKKKKEKNEK